MPSYRLSQISNRIAATPARRTNSQRVRAHLLREVSLSLALFALIGLLGCGGAGGGSSSSADGVDDVAPPDALDPINLDPGQTSAQVGWTPSEGPVESYLVFESRNGGGYEYRDMSMTASAAVEGQAGDSVQITVIAVSPTGEASEASTPSPPLVFHPAASAAIAQQAPSGLAPMTSVAAVASPSESTSEIDPTASAEPVDGNAVEVADAEVETTEADSSNTTRLAQATRAMLLGADARLPARGLSSEANQWLQSQVDHELGVGVSLAGTGQRDADALRELVWRDQAGQLFVSDGEDFLDSDDLSTTFEEALRLGATERFVGLADFDGNGTGDWLIEDASTGDAWIVDDATELSVSADSGTFLAGQGDFDGDGRAELLWLGDDNQIRITRPASASPASSMLDPAVEIPDDFEFLTIADLDGNGQDDLLGRGADGTLIIARVSTEQTAQAARAVMSGETDSATLTIEWLDGTTDGTDGLDLLATLDVDDDGAAEIAWLAADGIEIWGAESGLQMTIER